MYMYDKLHRGLHDVDLSFPFFPVSLTYASCLSLIYLTIVKRFDLTWPPGPRLFYSLPSLLSLSSLSSVSSLSFFSSLSLLPSLSSLSSLPPLPSLSSSIKPDRGQISASSSNNRRNYQSLHQSEQGQARGLAKSFSAAF